MRAVFLVALLVFVSGCGSRQKSPHAPIFVGKLEGGTFYKNPLNSPSNESGEYPKGSRAEVYEQFVIVTTPEGISHVHPHGYYSGLAIKKD